MNTVLETVEAVETIAPAAAAVECDKAVKCVVWDLDHTLWDGVLSEGDDVALKPGVREILQTLDARGILLSVASKNDHDGAMRKLREFGIAEYFLYPQISWSAKSFGIARLQQALNIGIDSILFVDDQPFELDEVRAVHPAVRCVAAEHYLGLPGRADLDPAVITEDGARRRAMYLEDMARISEEESFDGTPEDFLATLGMRFVIAPATADDLLRAEELTVRTNQLNSTGITYGMAELERFMHSDSHQLLICELTDKYGSYGKIGLALIERRAEADHIRLLLMSCRTVSRGVGSVLLAFLIRQAAAEGKRLQADFRRTPRNRQMLVTYQFANFREIARSPDGDLLFEHDASVVPEYPPYIDVKTKNNNRKAWQ